MESEVVQLKQKIKSLQRQLCDRTRNYLYHFKKSPTKKNSTTTDSSTQTEIMEQQLQHSPQKQDQDNHFSNIELNPSDSYQLLKTQQPKTQQKQENECHFFISLKNVDYSNTDSSISNNLKLIQSNITHQKEIEALTQQIRNLKQQFQITNPPKNIHEIKFEFLSTTSLCKTPLRQIETNQFSKKKQNQTIQNLSDSKFSADNSVITLGQDNQAKEIKILKKEIKKLKIHLENQIHASTQTKQALLISEEQNYKFRLQIQKLNKEIQIITGAFSDSETEKSLKPLTFEEEESGIKSVDSDRSESTREQLQKLKSQSEKYEEHILMLQGVKRDYLKRCIQAKEEIRRLKQQNQRIKLQSNQIKILLRQKQALQSVLGCDNQCLPIKYEKLEQKWIQVLKLKIHQISNCLPVPDNSELFLFKPDSIQQLISMLERILHFCKNIQSWQKQKIQTIQKQRSNLLKILSSLLVRHPQTKKVIAEEILQIEELKYLVNFMNKEPRSTSNSRVFVNLHDIETQNKEQEVIKNI